MRFKLFWRKPIIKEQKCWRQPVVKEIRSRKRKTTRLLGAFAFLASRM